MEEKELEEEIEQLQTFLFSPETWDTLITKSIRITLIVLVSMLVVRVLKVLIRRVFSVKIKGPLRRSKRREETLLKLLQSAVAYVVYFAAILAVLGEFQIDAKGLLAGAGVLGLAVGFGAQNLVRDVITGFFILFEDQFSVGDYVKVGAAVGTVEEIGLRTTKIQAMTGEMHIIPNGNITEVVNYSIRNSLAILDIGIAYEADIRKAERVIEEFLQTLPNEEYEEVVATPELVGVESLGASDVVLRITAETEPVMNFAVARKLRRDIKLVLEENDIEIPYQKMVIFHEDDDMKEGEV